MLDKIKKIINNQHWQNFRDIRFLGFVAFGIIVLLTTWSGANVIETNYKLQKQISRLDQQNQVSELENSNLQLQTQYFNTNTYLELTARQQFTKGSPGESLILVPKSVALAYAPKLTDSEFDASTTSDSESTGHQNNLQAWLNFFFHRQQN